MYSIFIIYFALGAAVAVSISVLLYDISRNDLNEEEELEEEIKAIKEVEEVNEIEEVNEAIEEETEPAIISLEDTIVPPGSKIPPANEESPFQQILADRMERINRENDFSEPLPLQSEKRESEIHMNEIAMPDDITLRHHEIYAAYDAGKSVEEIAQSCQRAQGEVELILRLRNHS